MRDNEIVAAAAAHTVDPDRWQRAFSGLVDRIAPLFARDEPLRHAAALVLGMLSTLDRKNCWTIAESRGYASPHALQHLLARAKWDVDQARDVLRGYVVEAFADPDAVLVVNETGDLKKGTHLVGVQRQYTGTAGRIEDSQVGVFLTSATRRGQVLIDRALYLPRCWVDDGDRRAAAGVPDDVEFATKPTRAQEMIERAVAVGTPVSWVAADEVYDADPQLRRAVRRLGVGYVLQIAANR